jgi:hypothetical protein
MKILKIDRKNMKNEREDKNAAILRLSSLRVTDR